MMKDWLNKHRKSLLLALAAALLIAAGLAAYLLWLKPAPVPQVVTAAVESGSIEDTVLATGTIGAAKLVSVGAQVTGEVKRLHVALGDTVKQGQLIAEIDALTQQNNLRNAQAALQNSQAQLRARQAALKQAGLAAERLRALVAIDAGAWTPARPRSPPRRRRSPRPRWLRTRPRSTSATHGSARRWTGWWWPSSPSRARR